MPSEANSLSGFVTRDLHKQQAAAMKPRALAQSMELTHSKLQQLAGKELLTKSIECYDAHPSNKALQKQQDALRANLMPKALPEIVKLQARIKQSV